MSKDVQEEKHFTRPAVETFSSMAAENPQAPNSVTRGFINLLSSAACEWLLILFLLLNSCLSHLLARFARYCHLAPPCLLCSTLDTALHKSKPGITYWNLLCHNHRQEISCLVSCTVHGKFADIHSLCEECLSPIVSRSKFTSDSYRLLVGKSWLDVDRSVLHNLVSNKHIRLGSPDHRTCSCCGNTWKAKSSTERLLELNPTSLGASKANVKPPLPRAPGHSRFSRRDSLKRLRDKFTGQITTVGTANASSLTHVGYTKLKISSDSESEFPFSEDDDDGRMSNSSSLAAAIMDGKATPQDSSGIGSSTLPDGDVLEQGGLAEDLGWSESHGKASPSPCLSPDLISLGDWPQQSDMAGGSLGPSALSVLSELLSLCNFPSSPGSISRKDDDAEGTGENGYLFLDKNIEAAIEASFDNMHPLELYNMLRTNVLTQTDEINTTFSSSSSSSPNDPDPSTQTKEIYNPTPSGLGSPPKQTSPRANEKLKTEPEVSRTSESPPSSSSPEKPDPNYVAPDITTAEGEGENIIESLKRQLEHDRNLLNTLYKDLEEERNASAIAANQAMAMITRLQEEKATLHMEALQYLRMMEEQAEYDMEALGRANDMLAEKEKELQDLEIELEFYRNNFLDESVVHNLQSENNLSSNMILGENEALEVSDGSLLSFEEERVYILQSLKKLEKNLLHKKFNDLPNGLHPIRNQEGLLASNGTFSNEESEDDSMLLDDAIIPPSNGILDRDMNRNDGVRKKGGKVLENGGEVNYCKLEKEIRELYERLEALETDRDFVKRTCELIRNGKDGFELVQEIARQLRELRKVEFKTRSCIEYRLERTTESSIREDSGRQREALAKPHAIIEEAKRVETFCEDITINLG